MKLTTLVSSLLTLTTPTLACLHVYGNIVGDPFTDDSAWGVFAVDNGRIVCSSDMGARFDQDNHFSMGCLPGYVYAFTRDGRNAWFANPSNAYSWVQSNHPVEGNCYGACDDKHGVCICGKDYSWDQWQFC